MAHFTTYANDLLDQSYQNGASGTFVVGPTTYTLPIKVEFTSTVSVAATPGTPLTGGSYPSGGITSAGLFTSAATANSKANTGAITATNVGSGTQTWADVYTHDTTGTPKPMNFRGGASLAKTVNAGDTCSIPIGSFTGTE